MSINRNDNSSSGQGPVFYGISHKTIFRVCIHVKSLSQIWKSLDSPGLQGWLINGVQPVHMPDLERSLSAIYVSHRLLF